jgi:hypothetical protein
VGAVRGGKSPDPRRAGAEPKTEIRSAIRLLGFRDAPEMADTQHRRHTGLDLESSPREKNKLRRMKLHYPLNEDRRKRKKSEDEERERELRERENHYT